MSDFTPPTYSPSELGRLTGLSPDSIRHYERIGILPRAARTTAGYRRYGGAAIARVKLVQSALPLGFTLRELVDVLLTYDRDGAPCQRVFNMMEQKLRETATQISELRRTERCMRQVLKDWRRLLARTPAGERAHLLHSLPASGGLARRRNIATRLRRRS